MLDALFAHRIDAIPDDLAALRRALPTHGGVYLLTDEQDQTVQLAACESLRRVLTRRLDPDRAASADRRADLRAVVRRIHYQPTHSAFETALAFHRIARGLHPNTSRDLCTLRPVYFARVDPNDPLPRFVVVRQILGDDEGTAIGPFPTRTRAAHFIEQIEDLFDLCREHAILDQTPNGVPCVYFDMGRCPAPCNGSIPLEAYRRSIDQAARFAAGDRADWFTEWTNRMRTASANRDFETAGRLKTRIERADKLAGPHHEPITDMRRFRFLAVQRGGGRSKVKPFYIHGGHITVGEPIPLRQLDEVIDSWHQIAAKPPKSPATDPVLYTERIGLVAHFLFKQDRAPGLFIRIDRLPAPAILAERIRARFAST